MIKRGEVYEVNPAPTIGREIQKKRPCVVVSQDIVNNNSGIVVVVPVTDAEHKKEDILNVLIRRKEGGTSKDSIALCLQVKAVDEERLDTKLGNLDAATMQKIDLGLRRIFGF